MRQHYDDTSLRRRPVGGNPLESPSEVWSDAVPAAASFGPEVDEKGTWGRAGDSGNDTAGGIGPQSPQFRVSSSLTEQPGEIREVKEVMSMRTVIKLVLAVSFRVPSKFRRDRDDEKCEVSMPRPALIVPLFSYLSNVGERHQVDLPGLSDCPVHKERDVCPGLARYGPGRRYCCPRPCDVSGPLVGSRPVQGGDIRPILWGGGRATPHSCRMVRKPWQRETRP